MKCNPHPDAFLEIVTHKIDINPGLTGTSVGYENGSWRCGKFVDHIMEWLPEFALSASETKAIGSHNAVHLIRKAARMVYSTDKYESRGEFGELLLHILLRQVFKTIPAISKIYYKDSANDTVKGFDAVHVINTGEELELWIGEAKFYPNFQRAMKAVVNELHEHLDFNYLESEFAIICNKIDDSWPYREQLKELLHRNKSLDEIIARICVPVLLTYDSKVVAKHTIASNEYRTELKEEFCKFYRKFQKEGLPVDVRIHLFLLPLNSKSEFIELLDQELKKYHGHDN